MKDALQKTHICETCPSSQWGDSNFCSTHQKKIIEITSCPEWNGKLYMEKNGQLTMYDSAKLMDIIQRTEEDVRNYRWMQKEIERIIKDLNDVGIDSSLVAQWGVEATLPKGKGLRSTINEKRLKRQIERLERLQNKIDRIDIAVKKVDVDERQRTVMECMLDGVRMNMIAQHIDVSRSTMDELKRAVITRLATEIYREELERG